MKILKLHKLCVLFLLAVPMIAYAQVGTRYSEPEGGFSICPPQNWIVMEFPGLKYKVIFAQPVNGFSPSINFVDEYYEGSLEEYVELSRKNMNLIYSDFEYVKQESFKTNSGVSGIKDIIVAQSSDRLLRQIFYFFQTGARKIVITCTVNTSYQYYEKTFDESIKTFEFSRR